MARTPRLSPIEAFRESEADAETLMRIAGAFPNSRVRAMRSELRQRVGDALRIRAADRAHLDCIENERVFLLFKNSNSLSKQDFVDTRPLLRQAIVAACAAFETYLADKVMECIGAALNSNSPPKRLKEIALTVGQWIEIENTYTRRRWGIRPVVEEAVREQASTAPNKVGMVLGMIGINQWSRKVDTQRGVSKGTTESELDAITNRRNRIAHAADRVGQGRADLKVDETDRLLGQIREIVDAIDAVVNANP